MAISITSYRPYNPCWSRNRFGWNFGWSFALPGDRLYIALQDAAYTTITELNYPISGAGNVRPEMSKLADATLKYVKPYAGLGGPPVTTIEECIGNIKTFNVQYRSGPPTSPVLWVQDSTPLTVIKGGIGDMGFSQEDGSNYTSLKLPRSSQFLTWVPSGRFQAPDEWGWLLFLCRRSEPHFAKITVQYLDGSNSVTTRSFADGGNTDYLNRNFFIPTGIDQNSLDPTGKGVATYSITVFINQSPSPDLVIESYAFKVDNRQKYDAVTLYYRNSLGGWDNLLLRGKASWSSDAARKEVNNSLKANGKTTFYDATIRPKWTMATGFLTREHMAVLNDLMLSTECAFIAGAQYLPVRITSSNLAFYETDNGLHFATIEIDAAGDFTMFPKQLATLR